MISNKDDSLVLIPHTQMQYITKTDRQYNFSNSH